MPKEEAMFGMKVRTWTIVGLFMMLAFSACSTTDPAPMEALLIEEVESELPAQEMNTGEAEAASIMEATVAVEPEGDSGTSVPEGMWLFNIVEDGTEARFIIDEVLRGEPTTVVGVTNKVSGEILVNLEDVAATEVSPISIEAGTLRTDNNFRNGAIENFILQSGSYPLITFTPTSINGLPEEVAVGDTVTFELTGDLTIREITQQVTFTVSVTATSKTQMRGSASTTILRQDFELSIPSVPQVASVSPQVDLELEFIALR
jgi:polyisoprenoid-binding protein YceI